MMFGSFPWFGWGRYTFESKSNHRCSIHINSTDATVTSYNISLLVFCYVIPILISTVSFVFIKCELKTLSMRAIKNNGRNSTMSQYSLHQERVFTLVFVVMVTAFMVAWTPYAICVFYRQIVGPISQTTLDVSAYLGKSSTLYNPIIYTLIYKRFKEGLLDVLRCRVRNIVNRQDV